MNIAIVGAGAVGRGLIAPLLFHQRVEHRITFIEREDDLARGLQSGYYPIRYSFNTGIEWIGPVDSPLRSFEVKGAMQAAQLVFVSVRPQNLESTVGTLRSSSCPIVAVENTKDAAGLLNGWLGGTRASNGIAECVIPLSQHSRTDPTFTYGDQIGYLVLEKSSPVDGDKILVSENFQQSWASKWYFHCGLHAVIAYIGLAKGFERIDEVLQNRELYCGISGAFHLLAQRVAAELNISPVVFTTRLQQELSTLMSPVIPDTCERVGRDAERKIKRGERLQDIRERVQHPLVERAFVQAQISAGRGL